MIQGEEPSNSADLSACEKEPIHIPGSIQPYGYLFVVDGQGNICQASQNSSELLGGPLDELLGVSASVRLGFHADHPPTQATFGDRVFDVSVRLSGAVKIVELEPAGEMSVDPATAIRELTVNLPNAETIRELSVHVVRLVRTLCGFDRVMVYRFLPDDTGVVIAEEVAPDIPSYLGLHYPASDIPPQARALYVKNWTRLVADVDYAPSPIVPTLTPATGKPLDMGTCALRSVSPIHVEYLKNMGVQASMSISLVRDGRLWGLVACHHMSPWYGGKKLRETCELIGQLASLQIGALEDRREAQFLSRGDQTLRSITERMKEIPDFLEGLAQSESELLDLVNAVGAAVIRDGRCHLVGATPSTTEVMRLTRGISAHVEEGPFATNRLSEVVPEASRYASITSGVLAICISANFEDYVLWFRPEVVETVNWAGNPDKGPSEAPGTNMLRPRTSFALWQQEVRHRSSPWHPAELTLAKHLRIAILENELRSLNAHLEKRVQDRTAALQKAVDELNGFTYSVSHDLRTPLRGMVGNSHIIIEEYGDKVPVGLKTMLRQIESNALRMANLVDDLLAFARLGRQELTTTPVNLSSIARRSADRLREHGWPCEGLDIEIEQEMRTVGDANQLEMLLTILIENGCKYRKEGDKPQVSIRSEDRHGQMVYEVSNVGIGFDNVYSDRLFKPFERLHRESEYPGTGIGLANAKRIVERHGGSIWANGRPQEGASFYFTLGS